MFRRVTIVFLTILLMPFLLKAQQQNGSILENRVTINLKNQPLNSILDQLSWQAGVYFSYDASALSSHEKFTVEVTDKSLYTVLCQLFNPSEFKFPELENQVIIVKNTEKVLPVEISIDSIPEKFFFLKGKIVEGKKQEPLKFASVSVLNKPTGTISNADGNFLLKIHPDLIRDTIIISCMGYSQILMPAFEILDEDVITMSPISIKIKEIKVTATTPERLLDNIRNNLTKNYSNDPCLMTGFYRETIKQDGNYINVSEAVVEVLKASYSNQNRTDLVRIVKGRRSPDVKPFQWINFKLQGGPFTITQLDMVKTLESFLDPEYQSMYNYRITRSIWYNENPVYILEFKPVAEFSRLGFNGEMYVDRETFAIVHIHFSFSKNGLKEAENLMIKKKPKGVKAKLTETDYTVNYQFYDGKWHLLNLKASVIFRVKSRFDRINSEYHSVSDLLITDIDKTDIRRFERGESFTQRDVFVEMIDNYDPDFWENYNIIKPDEDLQNAFKKQLLKP